ncbi:MAG: T9SS type A sorting domain-containing protein [Ignavibacteria bacterium]|nr:T9SS type A sorting domain-containing protein [Ignavibacteria bacterium]
MKTVCFSVVLLLLSLQTNAQVYREWVQVYSRAGAINDNASRVGIDRNGKIICVTAPNTEGPNYNYDMDVFKYEPNGTQVWVRTYAGPQNYGDVLQSWAIDNSSNIIIGGVTDYQCGPCQSIPFIIKYNTNGDSLWSKRMAPLTYHGHSPELLTDAADNIYYGAYWGATTPSIDAHVKKYNPSGTELLDIVWNVPGQREDLMNMKVDASGNIYIAGGYNLPTATDIFVRKYNSAGTALWTSFYNGTQNKSDFVWQYCMDIDAAGNVYVLGETNNDHNWTPGGNVDVVLLKYTSAGSLAWSKTFSGSANDIDYPAGLKVDTEENIIISMNLKNTATGYDAYFMKYNTSGDSIWSRRFNSPANLDDCTNSYLTPLIDKFGNSYFCGYYRAAANNGFDAICWKYSKTGVLEWQQTYNETSPDSNDTFSGVAIDSGGTVYCIGTVFNASSANDMILVKYLQPPLIPGNLSANAVSSSRINLSWIDNSNNETSFRIERSTNAGANWNFRDSVNQNITSYSDSGLAANTIYHYRISSRNAAGYSAPSNTALDTTFHPTGFINVNTGFIPIKYVLFQNYPNPFNPVTKIKFDIPQQSFTKLTMYDISGKEVSVIVSKELNPGSYEAEFNASNLPSGVYFYKLSSGGYADVKKMILVK